MLTSVNQKNRLFAKYLKTKSSNSLNNYKKYRNKLTHVKELAKRNYFENLFQGASNPSDTWKHVNQLLRRSTPNSAMPHTIKVNSNMISSPQKICQEMNEHFVKVGEKLSADLPDVKDKTYLKFLGKRNLSSIVIQPTDEYEVIQIISSLNNRKSPSAIDIPISLIKEAKFVIAGC